MAPEQAQGQAVDHRADIYSFGLIVYDMLIGRQRIARPRQPDVRDDEPDAARARRRSGRSTPRIPEALERIIPKCLQPSPTLDMPRPRSSSPNSSRWRPTAIGSRRLVPCVASQLEECWRWPRVLVVVLGAARMVGMARPGHGGSGRRRSRCRSSSRIFRTTPTSHCSMVSSSRRSGSASKGRRSSRRIPARCCTAGVQLNPGASLDEDNARLVARREGIKRDRRAGRSAPTARDSTWP